MSALPSHSPEAANVRSNVIIDFSRISQRDAVSGVFSATSLIEWVKSYPHRGSVRIVLPSSSRFSESRRLQNVLLSLGCTVTQRLSSVSR